ncbi:ADP-ribosyl-[dinitrogen reductase] hydrolase [Motiliproteus sediminis]|uniref:ADP-ribosyl-[dinitrogen reductase] hydrolase n=1 Tax=Motiliproteus sediminis TaxID=1468178 RepID=UPI001AEFF6B5|nr:ADP-ribosyl-[dinitrogen reductase] hydrolase [Motiliproteus sediminis]
MSALVLNNPPPERDATLLERVRGSYLGLAIGDALGATVEFMTPTEIAHQYGVHRDIIGAGWLKLKPGQVTDDTTMALALGRAIIDRHAIEASAIAHSFDAWMRAKPVDIGHTVRAGIRQFRLQGTTVMPDDEMSAGNGACMRCLPIALATFGCSEAEVRAASRCQAHITHNNPLSDAGTETVILMLQALLGGHPLGQQLHRFAQPLATSHHVFNFRRRACRNPSGFIGDTLRVVFEGLFDTGSFEDCLVEVVNRGGDADTTGAIAGMLAGACYGERAIPARWLKALDGEIRREVVQQAESLVAMAPVALR